MARLAPDPLVPAAVSRLGDVTVALEARLPAGEAEFAVPIVFESPGAEVPLFAETVGNEKSAHGEEDQQAADQKPGNAQQVSPVFEQVAHQIPRGRRRTRARACPPDLEWAETRQTRRPGRCVFQHDTGPSLLFEMLTLSWVKSQSTTRRRSLEPTRMSPVVVNQKTRVVF